MKNKLMKSVISGKKLAAMTHMHARDQFRRGRGSPFLDLASVGTTPATNRTDIMAPNTITKPESVYAEQS